MENINELEKATEYDATTCEMINNAMDKIAANAETGGTLNYERIAEIFNEHGGMLRWHPHTITADDLKRVFETRYVWKERYPRDIAESIMKVHAVMLTEKQWVDIYHAIIIGHSDDIKYSYMENPREKRDAIITEHFGSPNDKEFRKYSKLFRDKVRDLLGMSESRYEMHMERWEADAHLHAVLMDIKNSGSEEEAEAKVEEE